MRIHLTRLLALGLTAFVVSCANLGETTNNPSTTPTLSSLSVSPVAMTLDIGASQTAVVTAKYSDSSTLAVTDAVWTTSNAGIATVAAGAVTAVAPGTAVITATKAGKSVSLDVTVLAAKVLVNSITVSPTSVSLMVGATTSIVVTAAYSDGSSGAVGDAVFTSSDNAVAAVINGTLMAIKAGTATINVTKDGKSATVAVTVSDAGSIGVSYENLASHTVSITGANTLSQAGTSGSYTVTYGGTSGTYQWFIDGNAIAGATADTLSVDPLTLNTATHLITAVVTDPSGVQYSNTLNVKVTL